MLIKKLNDVKQVVFTVPYCLHLNRPQALLSNRQKHLKLNIAHASIDLASIHAFKAKRFMEVAILPKTGKHANEEIHDIG